MIAAGINNPISPTTQPVEKKMPNTTIVNGDFFLPVMMEPKLNRIAANKSSQIKLGGTKLGINRVNRTQTGFKSNRLNRIETSWPNTNRANRDQTGTELTGRTEPSRTLSSRFSVLLCYERLTDPAAATSTAAAAGEELTATSNSSGCGRTAADPRRRFFSVDNNRSYLLFLPFFFSYLLKIN